MKSKFFKILFMATAVVALSSCGSDDDASSNDNSGFAYDGTTIVLTDGIVEEYGENSPVIGEEKSYDFDITLFNGTFNYDNTQDEYVGQGAVLYLDLNSSSANGLTSGTYTFDEDPNDERLANTLVFGQFGADYNADDLDGDLFDITDGDVVLIVSGSTYTVTVNLELENGKAVVGSFKGELTTYDQQ